MAAAGRGIGPERAHACMPPRLRWRLAACLIACVLAVLLAASARAQSGILPGEAGPVERAGRSDARRLVFVTQQYPPFNYLERAASADRQERGASADRVERGDNADRVERGASADRQERGDNADRVAGPVPEIVAMACQRMGVDCTFRLLPWARAQQEVRNGMADGIFTIGRVPERESWLHFCPPLLRAEYGFFVRVENPLRYIAPRDVAGYRVGVYGPSLTSDILTQLARQTSMTVDMASDIDSGFLKLAQGRIDAVFANRENGQATIGLLRLANLRYAGWHSRVDYTVAFARHVAPEVVAAFEAALRALHREGELQRCLAAYGLQSAFPDTQGRDRGTPHGESISEPAVNAASVGGSAAMPGLAPGAFADTPSGVLLGLMPD